jgi:hypothetical protein
MGYIFSWLSLSKSTAETGLDVSEIAIIIAGLILTWGAVGEYLEDHNKLPAWMTWPKLVFIFMVVGGLVGEFFGDAGVFVFSGSLQSISDSEVARLNTEAGAARREAGNAIKEAAVLRLRAEELAEQILEVGPRDLMLRGKRADALVQELLQYAGQLVQIRVCRFENESRATAARLTALLEASKWRVDPHSAEWGESNCLIDNPTATGVCVGTPNSVPSEVSRARSAALVKSLGGIPLAAALHTVRPETARAENGQSVIARYEDSRAIVVVVMPHP